MLLSDGGTIDGPERNCDQRADVARSVPGGTNPLPDTPTSTSLTACTSSAEQALEWDSSFDYVRYQHQQQSLPSLSSEGEEGTTARRDTPAPVTPAPTPAPPQFAETELNLVAAPSAGDSSRSDRTDSTIITIRRQVSFPTISLKRAPGALDGLRGLTIVFEGAEGAEESRAAEPSVSPRARSETSFCSLAATEQQRSGVNRRASHVSQNTEYASLSEQLSSASAASQPPKQQQQHPTPQASVPVMPRPTLTGPAPPSIEKCARWLARHELAAGTPAPDAGDGDNASAAVGGAVSRRTHSAGGKRADRKSRTPGDGHSQTRQRQNSPPSNTPTRDQSSPAEVQPETYPSPERKGSDHNRARTSDFAPPRHDKRPQTGRQKSNHTAECSQQPTPHRSSAASLYVEHQPHPHQSRIHTPPVSIRKSLSAPAGTVQQRQPAPTERTVTQSRSAHAGSAAGLTRHHHATKLAEARRPARAARDITTDGSGGRGGGWSESTESPSATESAPLLPSLNYLDSAESDELIRRWRQDRKDFYQLAYLWGGADGGRLPSTGDDSGFSSSVVTQRASAEQPRTASPPTVQVFTATVEAPPTPPPAAESTAAIASRANVTPPAATIKTDSTDVEVVVEPKNGVDASSDRTSRTSALTKVTGQHSQITSKSRSTVSGSVDTPTQPTTVGGRRSHGSGEPRQINTGPHSEQPPSASKRSIVNTGVSPSTTSPFHAPSKSSATPQQPLSPATPQQPTSPATPRQPLSPAIPQQPPSPATPQQPLSLTTPVSVTLSRPRPGIPPVNTTLPSRPRIHVSAAQMPFKPVTPANAVSTSFRPAPVVTPSQRRRPAPGGKASAVHFSPSTQSQSQPSVSKAQKSCESQAHLPSSNTVETAGTPVPRLSTRSSTFTMTDQESAVMNRRWSGQSGPEQGDSQQSPRSVSSHSTSESRAHSSSRSSVPDSSASLSSPRRAAMPQSPQGPSTSPNVRPSSLLRRSNGRGRVSAAAAWSHTNSTLQTPTKARSRVGEAPVQAKSSTPVNNRRGMERPSSGRGGGHRSGTVTVLSQHWSQTSSSVPCSRSTDSGRRLSQPRFVPQPPRPLSVEREPNMRPNQPPPEGFRFTQHPPTSANVGGDTSVVVAQLRPQRTRPRISTHLDIVIQTDDESETQSLIELLGRPAEAADRAVQTAAPAGGCEAWPSLRQLSRDKPIVYNERISQGQVQSRPEHPPWSPPRDRKSMNSHNASVARHDTSGLHEDRGRQPKPGARKANNISGTSVSSRPLQGNVRLPGRQALNKEIETSNIRCLRSVSRERQNVVRAEPMPSNVPLEGDSCDELPAMATAQDDCEGEYSEDEYCEEPDAVFEVEEVGSDRESESPRELEETQTASSTENVDKDRLRPVRDTIRDYEVRSRSVSRERTPSPVPPREEPVTVKPPCGPRLNRNNRSLDDDTCASSDEAAVEPSGKSNLAADCKSSVSGRRGSFRHNRAVQAVDSVEYQAGYWREFDDESPVRRPPQRSRIPVRQVSREIPRPRCAQPPTATPPRYAVYEMQLQEEQRRAARDGRRSVSPPMRRNDEYRANKQARPVPAAGRGGREPPGRPHPWPPPQNDPVPSICEERRNRQRPRTAPGGHSARSETALTARRSYAAGRCGRAAVVTPPHRPLTSTSTSRTPRSQRPASARSAASSRATAGTPRSDGGGGGGGSISATPSSAGSGCGFCTLGYSEAELLQARLVRRQSDDGRPVTLRLDSEATFDGGRAVVRRLSAESVTDGHTQTDEFAHISSLLQLDLFPCSGQGTGTAAGEDGDSEAR